ncbi:MAG: hypothetical protein COA78_15030 [Blastopirellula sp.]|nr:MAG: hypothetical protein COA78_15030 [Blastopirellula sp.]
MTLIGIFLAKLFSPVIIMVGAVGGWHSKHWWHILVISLVAALFNEFLLGLIQFTRGFNVVTFITGVVAAALWAGVAVLVKRQRNKA